VFEAQQASAVGGRGVRRQDAGKGFLVHELTEDVLQVARVQGAGLVQLAKIGEGSGQAGGLADLAGVWGRFFFFFFFCLLINLYHFTTISAEIWIQLHDCCA
jgi:hypothetical protein